MLPFLLFLALDFDFNCQQLPIELNTHLNNTTAILQDRDGYLWFGGQEGLYRYDGYRLKAYRYNAEDPTSLSNNWVISLCEDEAGRLWVGTFNGGLCRMDRNGEGFTRFMPQLPGTSEPSTVEHILIDRDGILWAGLSDGLARFDGQQFTYFISDREKENSLSNGRTLCIFEDTHGNLWVATTDGGLNRFNPETNDFTRFYPPSQDSEADRDLQVWSYVKEDARRFWLGTNKGVFLFDPTVVTFKQFSSDFYPGLTVRSLCLDNSGLIWGGTSDLGAMVFDPKTKEFRFFPHEEGKLGTLPHNKTNKVFVDRTGVLWFGTLTGGVSKSNSGNFEFRSWQHDPISTNSLSDSFTKLVFQDSHNNIWVGGNQGLDKIDGETGNYRHFARNPNNPTSIAGNKVRAMLEDQEGNLWIGLWGGGLNRFDRASEQFTHFQTGSVRSLNSARNWIECLFIDSNQTFWVGNVIGPEHFSNGRFEKVPTQFTNKENVSLRVRVIKEPEPGRIYLGCDYGLGIIDEQGESYYAHDPEDPNSLSNNLVRSILRTRKGDIWIGTSGGLNRFDPQSGKFTIYSEKDGLANNVVYAILEDDEGRLWMGTNNGLSSFNVEQESFTNYTTDAGLQGREFNNGAALRRSDGLLFFGGTNGVTWFDPNQIRSRPATAPVVISEFRIYDRQVPFQKMMNNTLVFEPKDNFFSFEFALLDYSDPKRNRFQYMMEGIDEHWSSPSSRRFVNYTNLQPGEYQLRVRGAKSGGLWNPKQATLKIFIKTPIYQTLWFRTLGFVLFLAPVIGWLLTVFRSKKRLAKKVQERTLSLKQANESLAATNLELKKTQEELVDAAHQAGVAEVVIGVVHNIGNVLNSVSVSAETLTTQLERSRCDGVTRLATLLIDHQEDLLQFLTQDPQGKNLIPYLSRLSEILETEKRVNLESLERLKSGIGMLRDTVRMQQGYAKGVEMKETLQLQSIVEDMLILHSSVLIRHSVQVQSTYKEVAPVVVQRFKLAHIFTNLITNAIEAIEEQSPEERCIYISIWEDDEAMVCLSLRDTGIGIEPENLDRVFRYGFTTKKKGKGFGLHSCANSMIEMGGSLAVSSKGLGQGTTFSLALPRHRLE